MLMCVVYLPLVWGMIWSRAVRIVSDWAVASFHGKMWRENEFEGVRDALMNHETNESVLAHASRVTFQSDMRFVGGSNARMDHFWGGVGHEKKESFNWICFFARCFSFDFVPIFASSLLHRAQHNLQWNTFTKWYYIIICVICLTFNVTYRIRSHFFWISFSMMRSHLFVWHIGMIWHVLAISGIKSPVDDKLKSSATSFSRRVNLSPDHHYRTIRIREKSDANQARKWCAVCCAVLCIREKWFTVNTVYKNCIAYSHDCLCLWIVRKVVSIFSKIAANPKRIQLPRVKCVYLSHLLC